MNPFANILYKLLLISCGVGTAAPLFTQKSDWSPALSSLPPQVSDLIYNDSKYIEENVKVCGTESNLENYSPQRTDNTKNIIIKPADKGYSVVIMDRTPPVGGLQL